MHNQIQFFRTANIFAPWYMKIDQLVLDLALISTASSF